MHTIHLGDCLEILKQQPDNSLDAIITDPPYCSGGLQEASKTAAKTQGVRGAQWFTGDNMGTQGLAFLLRAVGFEAARVLKPSGSLLVFCDWRMFAALAPAVESSGLRHQNVLVWDKGHYGMGQGFRPQHELILHFTNGAPIYYRRNLGNVLRAGRVLGAAKMHPTQKPVELMTQLIEMVAPVGGVVFDPFMGSGSTGEAALANGRFFVGVERDPTFFEMARGRLERLYSYAGT